ncbi:MAG: UDP-N-acetylmuramate--L-alanine ligase, partial [Clostridiales bacterium]|nr:UDP-N-acetylmuramate--L-alanine ligase [Clostridiales bacterium]
MLTQILVMADYDPTAVIGGRLPLIESNGLAGKSDYMVCEACEFVDTFLKLSPDIAVLLNIDNDHLDYFKTMENLTDSFRKFVGMAGKAVIVNGDDRRAVEAADGAPGEAVTFGLQPGSRYRAAGITPGPVGMTFDLLEGERKVVTIELQIPGRHNVYNALAAAAAAFYLGVSPEDVARALAAFHGAGRRFEILGRFGGVTLADDYAHHPTELKATLTAAKNMDCKRVVAIFQPFTFSRTALLLDDFVDALSLADKVILTPIMGSREVNRYGVSSEDIAARLPDCVVLDTFDQVADQAAALAKAGDLLLTMGGGDIYKAAYLIRDRLEK